MERPLYRLAGTLFLALAIAGVLLPLVPATPFALLAAACFARSSEKWHRWMLNNKVFGPMIRDWEERRCVPARIKVVALLAMVVVGGFSVTVVVQDDRLRLVGLLLMSIGGLVLWRLPTCPREPTAE